MKMRQWYALSCTPHFALRNWVTTLCVLTNREAAGTVSLDLSHSIILVRQLHETVQATFATHAHYLSA